MCRHPRSFTGRLCGWSSAQYTLVGWWYCTGAHAHAFLKSGDCPKRVLLAIVLPRMAFWKSAQFKHMQGVWPAGHILLNNRGALPVVGLPTTTPGGRFSSLGGCEWLPAKQILLGFLKSITKHKYIIYYIYIIILAPRSFPAGSKITLYNQLIIYLIMLLYILLQKFKNAQPFPQLWMPGNVQLLQLHASRWGSVTLFKPMQQMINLSPGNWWIWWNVFPINQFSTQRGMSSLRKLLKLVEVSELSSNLSLFLMILFGESRRFNEVLAPYSEAMNVGRPQNGNALLKTCPWGNWAKVDCLVHCQECVWDRKELVFVCDKNFIELESIKIGRWRCETMWNQLFFSAVEGETFHQMSMLVHPPWNEHSLWKWLVGKLLSFWEGLFSGTTLVSGRVLANIDWFCQGILEVQELQPLTQRQGTCGWDVWLVGSNNTYTAGRPDFLVWRPYLLILIEVERPQTLKHQSSGLVRKKGMPQLYKKLIVISLPENDKHYSIYVSFRLVKWFLSMIEFQDRCFAYFDWSIS